MLQHCLQNCAAILQISAEIQRNSSEICRITLQFCTNRDSLTASDYESMSLKGTRKAPIWGIAPLEFIKIK
jgi:hypothetical protein